MTRIKESLARIYRPGMSLKGSLQMIIDWVGGKGIAIGAAAISFVVTVLSFILFAAFFALVFSIILTIIVFIIAKALLYKPKEYSIEIEGEDTVLSFVKDVNISGESEIVIYSQPGYGKEKNTFVHLQLFDSISILNCRNITSVTDTSYKDITIKFFHPVTGDYSVKVSSNEGNVSFEVLEKTADQCRIEFLNPVRKTVELSFVPTA